MIKFSGMVLKISPRILKKYVSNKVGTEEVLERSSKSFQKKGVIRAILNCPKALIIW